MRNMSERRLDEHKLEFLLKAAIENGLSPETIWEVASIEKPKKMCHVKIRRKNRLHYFYITLAIFLSVIIMQTSGKFRLDFESLYRYLKEYFDGRCLVNHSILTLMITRPLSDCSMCNNLQQVSWSLVNITVFLSISLNFLIRYFVNVFQKHSFYNF